MNPPPVRVPARLSDIFLAVVCPMANEAPTALRFVNEILARCGEFRQVAFYAVLDRATTDNSLALLRDLARTEPRLQVIWAPENRCVVDAYVCGYRKALAVGADWILEIDAGFSHQPEDLARFFAAMQQGYDCVFGCRFMQGSRLSGMGWKRYAVSRGGTWLTNLLLGTQQRDMTSGFELFSRPTLEMILKRGIESRAHFFQTEIKVYCRHLNFVEVPIHYASPSPRLGGSAIKDSFRQLWRLRKLRAAGQL